MTSTAGVPHGMGLLLALQRVRAGAVSPQGPDSFVDQGRPFPAVLVPFLRELFDHGQVRIEARQGDRDPLVMLTAAGEALLAELRDPSTSDEPT